MLFLLLMKMLWLRIHCFTGALQWRTQKIFMGRFHSVA